VNFGLGIEDNLSVQKDIFRFGLLHDSWPPWPDLEIKLRVDSVRMAD
jgi:hypothetical protein